jgi:DNA-directed RNA polymerase beta subunit
MPNLVKDQVESFKWLVEHGVKEVMDEFAVINDFSGKKFKFEFLSFELEEPKYGLRSRCSWTQKRRRKT